MAGSGAALTRANVALASSITASANAAAAQATASAAGAAIANMHAATIFAADYGVVADGVTDNASALYNAINACQTSASTYTSAQFRVLILPAGVIRIASPVVLFNNLTSLGMRIQGTGHYGTTILADFSFGYAAPQFTVSGGSGSGCVLYPIIDSGVLTAVRVISGGTGYTSAPTATLVTYNNSGTSVGSGATVSLTVSGGAVTAASVTAGGSNYAEPWLGDALVFRGSFVELYDIALSASAARQAASNGGTSAYPYFTTNNGIRMEPIFAAGSTVVGNRLDRVNVGYQPGHGINVRMQEQLYIGDVQSGGNGADGLFVHCAGIASGNGNVGINNSFVRYRGTGNGCRGLSVSGQEISSFRECAVYSNLQAYGCIAYATLTSGGLSGASIANSGMNITAGTAAVIHGGGGSGAAATPTIVNGRVTGFTFTAGSGYSTSGYSPMYITVAGPGLPSGVNEEVCFSLCYNQDCHIDVESNTGLTIAHDLIRLAGCYGGRYGGGWRGGQFGINANTVTKVAVDDVYHVGNSSDVSNATVYIAGGTGTTNIQNGLYIGANVLAEGQVNLTVNWAPSTNPFGIVGYVNGTMLVTGLLTTPYTWTYAATITPNAGLYGWDQIVPLTGNITINASINGGTGGLPLEGTRMNLIFKQDATGGRVVTMTTTGTGCYVGANIASIGSGTANQIGQLGLVYRTNGSRGVWVQEYWSGWL